MVNFNKILKVGMTKLIFNARMAGHALGNWKEQRQSLKQKCKNNKNQN